MKKLVLAVLGLAMSASAIAAPAPDSKRLALAKDYIAEEQWTRAIAELQAVSADASDPNRDEALFWLAHSEYQVGDQAAALEAMARLERLFPKDQGCWLSVQSRTFCTILGSCRALEPRILHS